MDPFESLELILSKANLVDQELTNHTEALGRVLSEGLDSKLDLPSYDNSAMDGYALRYDDLINNKDLKVVGTIKCGDIPLEITLKEGECYKIMTGAFIPSGADSVVEFEKTTCIQNLLKVTGNIARDSNIRKKGEDIKKFDKLPFSGKVITPALISRLVSTGNFTFNVFRKPKIAIISTGSELTAPCENFNEFSVIESNSSYIKESLRRIAVDVVNKGIFKDEFEIISSIFASCTPYDAIVTIGGISKGDYDIIKIYGADIGIDWLFNGVDQKPGSPFSFGLYKDIPVFSFPGNPVSSDFCCFYYLIPFLKKMMGYNNYYNKEAVATLKENIFKKNNAFTFFNANLAFEKDRLIAYPYKRLRSNLINSLVNSKGYIMIDKNVGGEISAGNKVKVIFNDIPFF
jgi:molybdopterin molybdotransferase